MRGALNTLAADALRRISIGTFLGASTTENWAAADPGLFSANVINRGIGGQTTQQLLLRFTQDVLSLRPLVLHLMASSNDIVAASSPSGVTLAQSSKPLIRW